MKRFFDRAFSFLDVDDPKQSKVNRLFFCLIVGWIGLGFCVNIISFLWYHLVTLPEHDTAIIQQSSFFQMEIPNITLVGWLSAALTAVALYHVKTVKNHREEIKTVNDNYRSDSRENTVALRENAIAMASIRATIQEIIHHQKP